MQKYHFLAFLGFSIIEIVIVIGKNANSRTALPEVSGPRLPIFQDKIGLLKEGLFALKKHTFVLRSHCSNLSIPKNKPKLNYTL